MKAGLFPPMRMADLAGDSPQKTMADDYLQKMMADQELGLKQLLDAVTRKLCPHHRHCLMQTGSSPKGQPLLILKLIKLYNICY